MDFRRGHLLYFVTVAEEGHMTRAAERLHIAQPTLSQAIARLESDLGFELLRRKARGVELTQEGEAFLVKARTALAAWTAALEPARTSAGPSGATIVFGFLGVPPTLDSPGHFENFSHAHPGIDLRYRELPFPTSPTSAWLDDVDVAVCHQPPRDPDVWMRVVRSELRVVLASRDHPIAARADAGVADLLDEVFIGFHPTVEPGWAGFWSLDDHRGAPPREVTRDAAATPQEVIAAVALSSAITTVPASVARTVSSGFPGVAAIPLRDATPALISLVGHEDCRNPSVPSLLAFTRDGSGAEMGAPAADSAQHRQM